MRDLPMPWEGRSDPDECEALARDAISQAQDLKATAGWIAFSDTLEAEITELVNELVRGSANDEQNRGAIRVLRHAKQMPDRLIREASAEINRHRGTP